MMPYITRKRITRKSSSFVKTKKRIKKIAATTNVPRPTARLVKGVTPAEMIKNPTPKLSTRQTDAAIVTANRIEIYHPENDLIITPITPANERIPISNAKLATRIVPETPVVAATSTRR